MIKGEETGKGPERDECSGRSNERIEFFTFAVMHIEIYDKGY